jgi:S-adenosylmethionine:tRNA ribosyltransferase-isomerase
MELNDFDYELPRELIAQEAVTPKDNSRLMVVGKNIEHKHFYNLINYLEKGDVLVINETKVAKAKLVGKKITGTNVEIVLVEKIDDLRYKCRIKGRVIRVGNICEFDNGLICDIVSQDKDVFVVKFNKDPSDFKESFSLPTPPYVKRVVRDEEYQTVYFKEEGSLAAPTAGLHFTNELLDKIEQKGVKIARICLHIDYNTFLEIVGDLKDHKMHKEYYEISAEAADIINNRKGRLIAVGTTCVRAIESAAVEGKVMAKKEGTEIFIYPGYKFKMKIDGLITNFHLPKSTLLMLVSAYYGLDRVLEIYKEAVKEKYRFYSLGDAMFLS